MKLKINTGLMWISVAVIFAIWVTKSAVPLWTFLIPALVGYIDNMRGGIIVWVKQ